MIYSDPFQRKRVFLYLAPMELRKSEIQSINALKSAKEPNIRFIILVMVKIHISNCTPDRRTAVPAAPALGAVVRVEDRERRVLLWVEWAAGFPTAVEADPVPVENFGAGDPSPDLLTHAIPSIS